MKDRDGVVEKEFLTLLMNTLDSYSIEEQSDAGSRELKNWLGKKIEYLNNKLTDFLMKYSSESQRERNNILECVINIVEFNKIGNE